MNFMGFRKTNDTSIYSMSIDALKEGYRYKLFSVKEAVQEYLKRIESLDEKIGAFLTVCADSALGEAEAMDEKIAKGQEVGLLGGVPIAIKDNICTRGLKTTCASRVLEDFIPPYDATIIKKLNDAGAIILGKVNLDEFAIGSSTETSAFQRTYNPWNLSKVPGGSSGGSAAAVAAGFAPMAVGTDTGGSISQPAAFCGTVGLKPTYGAVSRYGLIPFASSLDTIGPITGTVTDCALSFQALRGQDMRDATSAKTGSDIDYVTEMKRGVQGLKIGIVREWFNEDLDPEIEKTVRESAQLYEKAGAWIEDISLPIIDCGISAYYIISSAEASSNLAGYDGLRYGYGTEHFTDIEDLIASTRSESFGKEVKGRIMLGTLVLSSDYYDDYYYKSLLLRKKIRNSFKEIFKQYDLLIMPTTPTLPYDIGELQSNPLEMLYTATMNLAGIPSISIPCGFSNSGLPIGLQLTADHFAEDKLFRGAYQLEQELGIVNRKPDLDIQEVEQNV
jgi:aspartyl-tRNA(Asn)/glutamyl-tRNA(Gln) amidotransferase subunit A